MLKKTILSTIMIIFIFAAINKSKADDFSDAIVKAKKKFKDAANKDDSPALLKVRGDFERILQLKKNQWLVDYYMAYTDLMLAYFEMDKKNNDVIKKYTESCLDLLNKATDLKDDFAEAWIVKLSANTLRFTYEMDKMNDIIA